MSNRLDSQRLRQQAGQELRRSQQQLRLVMLLLHVLITVIFLTVIWGIALSNPAFSDKDSPLVVLVILPTILGLMGCIFHGVSAFADTRLLRRGARDQAMMRAIGREMMRQGLDFDNLDGQAEKRKRDLVVRLSDDGELLAEEEQDQQEAAEGSTRAG